MINLSKVSIIYINYFSKKNLINSLESVKEFYNENFEIIIFNNSKEEILSDLKERYYKIKLINSIENVGYTKGCNLSVKQSNKDYILFLNPDTIIINDFITIGLEFLEKNREAGAVGFKILNPDNTIQKETIRNTPTPMNVLLHLLYLDKLFKIKKPYYHEKYNNINEVEVLSGACMLIRKEAFIDINGFDEKFFLYGDDIDFCIRLRKKGWKIYYLPIESVIHLKGGSLNKFSFKRIYFSHKAMFLFSQKYYSNKILLFSLITIGIFLKFTIFIFISLIISLKNFF